MYLEVFPNGTKSWRMKYRIAGKEKRVQRFDRVFMVCDD